jgi:hypothetical protein
MIGEHTVKSQRPRSVFDTKALQEQAESAQFMAQTGNTIVMFPSPFILLTYKLNVISVTCMFFLVLHLIGDNVSVFYNLLLPPPSSVAIHIKTHETNVPFPFEYFLRITTRIGLPGSLFICCYTASWQVHYSFLKY